LSESSRIEPMPVAGGFRKHASSYERETQGGLEILCFTRDYEYFRSFPGRADHLRAFLKNHGRSPPGMGLAAAGVLSLIYKTGTGYVKRGQATLSPISPLLRFGKTSGEISESVACPRFGHQACEFQGFSCILLKTDLKTWQRSSGVLGRVTIG